MADNKRRVREFLNEIRERIDDFTFDQIYMIEYGLLSELPLELIRFYARPEFDAMQMSGIYQSFMNGFSLEQLQRYITSQLNELLWIEIVHWAKYGLDFERFVQELGEAFLPKISYYLLKEVREDLILGLSWEKIKDFIQICKEKNCLDDDNKIIVINKGILAGVPKKEIETYIRPWHDYIKSEQIMEKLIWSKKTRFNEMKEIKETEAYLRFLDENEEIESFLESLRQSGRFFREELEEIELGFANGLTVEQVKLYVDEKLSSEHKRMIRLYLQAGYPKGQIRFLVNLLVNRDKCPPAFRSEFDNEVSLWFREGLPLRILSYLLQYSTNNPSWLNWWRRKLRKLPKRQIIDYFEKVQLLLETCKDFELRGIIRILDKLPDDQVEIYSRKIQTLAENYKKAGFNHWQTLEIILGYLDGLSEEQINFYARHGFSQLQMEQIRLAYLDGLTQEEVEFLANPEFTYDQMKAIRLSFKFGLTFEQVKKFARPEYSFSYMKEFLLGYLWGLPEEAIEFYMNTKLKTGEKDRVFLLSCSISYRPQTILRIALLKGLTIPEIEYGTHKFLESESLKATLEKLVTDKEARAKVKALIKLSTELKENWKKNISEMKRSKKEFTL